MTTFESPVKSIASPQESVFNVLSDLRNIRDHLDKLPDDQVKIERLEEDAVYFKVELAGEFGLRIIERDPFKTIKFEAIDSPIQFNLWIQLKELNNEETAVKLTIKADLNPMVKMMISKHISKFLNMLAEAIASIDYQ